MTREIRRNDDGSLDDIFIDGPRSVHIEQMGAGEWWVGIDFPLNNRVSIFLTSRGRIKATLAESTKLVKDTGDKEKA